MMPQKNFKVLNVQVFQKGFSILTKLFEDGVANPFVHFFIQSEEISRFGKLDVGIVVGEKQIMMVDFFSLKITADETNSHLLTFVQGAGNYLEITRLC